MKYHSFFSPWFQNSQSTKKGELSATIELNSGRLVLRSDFRDDQEVIYPFICEFHKGKFIFLNQRHKLLHFLQSLFQITLSVCHGEWLRTVTAWTTSVSSDDCTARTTHYTSSISRVRSTPMWPRWPTTPEWPGCTKQLSSNRTSIMRAPERNCVLR